MVAHMTREAQLKRVHALLVKAQQQGMTKKQFVDNLSYFLAKDGWAPKGRGCGILYRFISTARFLNGVSMAVSMPRIVYWNATLSDIYSAKTQKLEGIEK